MARLDASTITLLTQYDAGVLTDEQLQLLVDIAIDRLNALLCDTLDAENLEPALLLVVAELVAWLATNNSESVDVRSETTENYSYTKDTGIASLNARILDKYSDVLARFSKCETKAGDMQMAGHNPLWTIDYYEEKL